ncbi:MAG: tetratricopeptide repeat protein [Deltaproteobacteria bacterium]
MRRVALLSALALVACEVDFAKKDIADPGLARRIAQQKAQLQSAPNDGAAWLALADMYFAADQFFDAADAYVRAEALGAPKTPVLAGLANTYLKLGYYQKSIDRLKSCFQLNRNEPMCLYALGTIMESNGDERSLADARRAYMHFLAVAGEHERAAYVKSRIDQITARIGPPDPTETIAIGPSSQPASQPAGAPPGAHGAAPTNEPTAPNAPSSPHAPGSPTGAPATNGPAGVPGHGDGDSQDVGQLNAYGLAIQKALAATRANDIPAAQTAYTEALKLRPGDPSARAGLAETYLAQGKIDDAAKMIEGAYDDHPTDPQVRWMFGTVMLQAQRRQREAIEAWESLVEEYPDIAGQLGIPQRLEAAKKFMGPN